MKIIAAIYWLDSEVKYRIWQEDMDLKREITYGFEPALEVGIPTALKRVHNLLKMYNVDELEVFQDFFWSIVSQVLKLSEPTMSSYLTGG